MKIIEEIEKLADEKYLKKAEAINDSTLKGFILSATKGGYIDGYTQCQEDMADKKYTEEDMREAIDMARMLSHVSCLEEGEHRLKYSNTEDKIIKSLNKQD